MTRSFIYLLGLDPCGVASSCTRQLKDGPIQRLARSKSTTRIRAIGVDEAAAAWIFRADPLAGRQILTPRLCFGVYGFSVGQVGRTTTSRAPVATGL